MNVIMFNLNDEATVTLTDEGYEILKKHALSYGGRLMPREIKALETGELSAQMHELFRIFGPQISMGRPTPFRENTVRVIAGAP